jgi:hypothetical protein
MGRGNQAAQVIHAYGFFRRQAKNVPLGTRRATSLGGHLWGGELTLVAAD